MNDRHLGTSFNSFLDEEGIRQDVESEAVKRVIALELERLMKRDKLTKTELAHRLETSRAALDRLLDPTNDSVTLATIKRAAAVLGKQIRLILT